VIVALPRHVSARRDTTLMPVEHVHAPETP
jgi:hypothetical protein